MKEHYKNLVVLAFTISLLASCGGSSAKTVSYTNNGDATITANDTGLMWQQQDDGAKRTWAEATTYCTGLALGGYSGWRLPSIDELTSIIDTSYTPTINPAYFTNTKSEYYNAHPSFYWSSTDYDSYTDYAWNVDFYYGKAVFTNKTYDLSYVRCVRQVK